MGTAARPSSALTDIELAPLRNSSDSSDSVSPSPRKATARPSDDAHKGVNASSSSTVEEEDGDVELENSKPASSLKIGHLTWVEKRNIAILYAIYTVHALPLTFSWVSMPILLRQTLSYSLLGSFMVSQYPYSVKVLWSPLVQTCGSRRGWLVSCFLLGGGCLFWLAFHQDSLIARTAVDYESAKEQAPGGRVGIYVPPPLVLLVGVWFLLILLCANIRLALDDWSLGMLSPENIHWISATVTLAELTAAFFSFNLFLGLSSLGNPEAGTAAAGEQTSTRAYFYLTGIAFVTVSIVVWFVNGSGSGSGSEPPNTRKFSVRTAYAIILRIVKLRQTHVLMAVHMTSMIGFLTNDDISMLQLVKAGFSDRDIAGLATVCAPLIFLGGLLVSKLFSTQHPLHVWRMVFPFRLAVALCNQIVILLITKSPLRNFHFLRLLLALVPLLASTQLSNLMYIALVAFHAQIADPACGGIYLPLLATTLNIRYDLMGFVFTKTIGWIDAGEGLGVGEGNLGDTAQVAARNRLFDGYQIVNLVAVMVALPVFVWFLRPATMWLQETKRESWRVGLHDSGMSAMNVDGSDGEGNATGGRRWGFLGMRRRGDGSAAGVGGGYDRVPVVDEAEMRECEDGVVCEADAK